MVESPLAMAEGNIIKGMAIPVRIPYWLRAWEEVRPWAWRVTGSRAAWALWRKFMMTRVPVRGAAIERTL